MKKILLLLVLALLAYGYVHEQRSAVPERSSWSESVDRSLQKAYELRKNDLQIRGEGIVVKVLPDDREGSRHQRFILQTSDGPSVLVAHNIDLAPRINELRKGDTVEFFGEYEWNEKGGVIHWTHHDPGNRHVGGWLQHNGTIYQ